MGKKYLTPFDKSMAELFGKAYDEVVDLFTDDDDEEEKQRKLEEDRKKQKPERKENVYSNITNYTEAVIDLLPAAKYYTEDTSNLTKQQQKDRQILGNKFQTSVFVNEDGTMVAAPVSGVDMEELEEKLKLSGNKAILAFVPSAVSPKLKRCGDCLLNSSNNLLSVTIAWNVTS